VYAIDCMVSTGNGRTSEADTRVTVYKRDVEATYGLKTQKARAFISEVNRRFPTLPFNIRAIEDDQVRGLGVSEADRHELIEPYPVMQEKAGEVIAQFKFTVLLLPGGTKKVAGLPFNQEHIVKSAHEVKDEDLKSLLKTSANPKKKKKSASAKKEAAKE